MKPYLKIVVVTSMFASVCYWNSIKTPETMKSLILQNVEALADDEAPGSHNHGPTRNPLIGKKYCKNENQVNCAY